MIKLQELGFIQIGYTTDLMPQKNNARRTMFSVTPAAIKAVEAVVNSWKGGYSVPKPASTQSGNQSVLSPIIGHSPLYKSEESCRRGF